jgi:hypothetical protein
MNAFLFYIIDKRIFVVVRNSPSLIIVGIN